jgi:hypothetical protein
MKTKNLTYVILFILIISMFNVAHAGQVTLSWTAPNDTSVTGYKVFMRYEGDNYNYDQPIWEGTSVSCTLIDLVDRKTFFVVRAYAGTAGVSANSNEVYIMAAPEGLNVILYTSQ